MTWVLIISLTTFKQPLALSAISRQHCIDQMEEIRVLKGYESSVCLPVFNWDEE